MRNNYEGKCYYCGKTVGVGKGHFERASGKWKTIHAQCVIYQRADKKEKIEPSTE